MDYFLSFQENIQTQKLIIDTAFQDTQFGDHVASLAEATTLATQILNDPFVTNSPNVAKLDKALMAEKATLALWIGWAYARDVPYWYHSSSPVPPWPRS